MHCRRTPFFPTQSCVVEPSPEPTPAPATPRASPVTSAKETPSAKRWAASPPRTPIRTLSTTPRLCRRSKTAGCRPRTTCEATSHGGRARVARLGRAPLVPQPHDVPVGVDDLGAISPRRLARRMRDSGATLPDALVFGVDVVDLEVENTSRRIVHGRSLHEEDREIVRVADRGGRCLRHRELHC